MHLASASSASPSQLQRHWASRNLDISAQTTAHPTKRTLHVKHLWQLKTNQALETNFSAGYTQYCRKTLSSQGRRLKWYLVIVTLQANSWANYTGVLTTTKIWGVYLWNQFTQWMVCQECCTEVPMRYTINRIPGNTVPRDETYCHDQQVSNNKADRISGSTGE